jgi:hypothetical protein
VSSPPEPAVDQQTAAPEVAAVTVVAAGAGGLLVIDGIRRLYLAATITALHLLRAAVNRTLRSDGDPQVRFDTRWRLDRQTLTLASRLAVQARDATLDVVGDAQRSGTAAADRDLNIPNAARPSEIPDPLDTDLRASQVAVDHQRIVTVVDDMYRQTIAQAFADETGRTNRRRVAQRALDGYAARGISVFRDRAGREWDIAAYAEMAVRTVAAQAQVDAYVHRARAAGVTRLQVSVSPTCCSVCAPYDGQIVNIDSPLPPYHPNCRHSVSLVRVDRPITPPVFDPDREAAQQRLRHLERRVRAARRLEAVALDPEALRRARAQVRAGHAAIRDHITRTGLTRQRHRERTTQARG